MRVSTLSDFSQFGLALPLWHRECMIVISADVLLCAGGKYKIPDLEIFPQMLQFEFTNERELLFFLLQLFARGRSLAYLPPFGLPPQNRQAHPQRRNTTLSQRLDKSSLLEQLKFHLKQWNYPVPSRMKEWISPRPSQVLDSQYMQFA